MADAQSAEASVDSEITALQRVMVAASIRCAQLHGAADEAFKFFQQQQDALNPTNVRGWQLISPWTDEAARDHEVQGVACGLVEEYITSVRCAKDDLAPGAVFTSPRAALVEDKAVLLYVWKSRREGIRCHEAFRRLHQTKFEHMMPYCLQIPIACACVHQGALVSCIWLPPLHDQDPVKPPRDRYLYCVLEMYKAALALTSGTSLPVYLGLDSRLYLMGLVEAVQPRLSTPEKHTARQELLAGLKVKFAPQACLEHHIPEVLVPKAADACIERFALQQDQADKQQERPEDTVRAGSMSGILHQRGLNCCFMGRVYLQVEKFMTTSQKFQTGKRMALDALRGEMAARTLKVLLLDAMAAVVTPAHAPAEMVEMARHEAAEKVVKKFTSSAAFFDQELLPFLKEKFMLARESAFVLQRKELTSVMGAMLGYVSERCGLLLSGSRKDVEAFEIRCVKSATYQMAPSVHARLHDREANIGTVDDDLLFAAEERESTNNFGQLAGLLRHTYVTALCEDDKTNPDAGKRALKAMKALAKQMHTPVTSDETNGVAAQVTRLLCLTILPPALAKTIGDSLLEEYRSLFYGGDSKWNANDTLIVGQ